MPVTQNRYFNDPALGQAFSNLASAFGPPSGSDLAGYASAKAKREEAGRLAELFNYAKDPTYDQGLADRMAVLGGLYTPNSSYYAVNLGDQTTRRGQDVTASTSRANNAADNVRALEDRRLQELAAMERLGVTDATARYGHDQDYRASRENNTADNSRALEAARMTNTTDVTKTLLGPVAEGATRFVPPSIADMYGLPATQSGNIAAAQGETITTPDGRVISGAAKPLTDAELKAQILSGLPANEQRAAALGSVNVENIVGEGGIPEIAFRSDAVGKRPYFNKGAEAKPQNAVALMPDGKTRVPALQDPDGRWVHAQTGQTLPEGIQIFDLPKATGSAADIGLGPTTANATSANNQEAEVTRTLGLLDVYENALDNNPGALGLAGLVRGTAQNAVATATDLAKAFGGSAPQVQEMADELRTGLQGVAPQLFDPSIPEIAFLQGTLAYSLARTENPSGEVSRQAYERARARQGRRGARQHAVGKGRRRRAAQGCRLAARCHPHASRARHRPHRYVLSGRTSAGRSC